MEVGRWGQVGKLSPRETRKSENTVSDLYFTFGDWEGKGKRSPWRLAQMKH